MRTRQHHRKPTLKAHALHHLANSSYRALPVTDLIAQAEREAQQRAQEVAPVPLADQVAALASKWGAKVRTTA